MTCILGKPFSCDCSITSCLLLFLSVDCETCDYTISTSEEAPPDYTPAQRFPVCKLRHTHWHTDTRADRQTDTLTDRQWQTHTLTDTHTDRQTHWQTGRHTHTDRLTDRQTHTHRHAADIHWQTHTHTHKSTDRHTDTLTDRQTNQALYYQISSSDPYSVLLDCHQSTSITNERAGQDRQSTINRIAGHLLVFWAFVP